MVLDDERQQLYKNLESKIGNTPMEQYLGNTPNGNKIWIKRECENPFGSPYDRVYIALFKHYEEQGEITQGCNVLETTSGSAGVSFAGIGRLLGYNCLVMLPDAPKLMARKKAIIEQGATIIPTPAEEYIAGFTKERILSNIKKYNAFFLNHSMGKRGTNNEITLKSLEGIAEEVLNVTKADYFIPAIGNGSSALGPGRVFKENGTKIIAFETIQSAVAYDQKYPGLYEQKYGIKPGTLPQHDMPGTSFQGIDFPHIRNAINTIDEVILVSDEKMDSDYLEMTGNKAPQLPHWDDSRIENHEDLGRSTKAGIAVALQFAEHVQNKNLVVIGYDKANRY